MYSPIKKLHIKNFRNIGEVEIDFTQSPIVTLVGENEAGKTSVIKAFSVCALHSTPRDQKDYIRDGTQMFGVAIELEDGSKITRIKTSTSNKYQVVKSDGTVWETSKISEGLPIEVQNLMGLIEEPETKEYLHIRTYEDKLLFVVTPASANYKVMYNALKVEQLTKAIKKGSDEINLVRGRLNDTGASIRTLEGSLSNIHIVDIEPLVTVKDRLVKQLSSLDKLERAMELQTRIKDCKQKLGLLELINKFKLEDIDLSRAYNLNSVGKIINTISELSNERNNIAEVDSLEIIDTSIVTRVSDIITKIKELDTKKANAGTLIQVSEISEINESSIIQLDRAKTLLNTIKTSKAKLDSIDVSQCSEIDTSSIEKISKCISIKNENATKNATVIQLKDYLQQAIDWMKAQGVAFETCQNCGSDVLIDLDKLG